MSDTEETEPLPDFSEGARILAEARIQEYRLADAPRPEPANIDEAYAYQDLVTAELGLTLIGWKVGATNAAAQSAIGAKEPFVGPLFVERLHKDGDEVPSPKDAQRVTEAEFALKLKTDLPPRGAAYGFDEVANAIASVHPAVEIVNKRLSEPASNSVNWVVADGGASHSLVLGEAFTDIASLDLSTHSVFVDVNGARKAEGSGGAVMGNPIMVLAWLATHLSNRGVGLKAGDIISTGLTTPIFRCVIGDEVTADFGIIGKLSFKLTE